jgi:hypothetical protein
MPRKYAEGTSVDTTRSRIEIETIVRRFGATQIVTFEDGQRAVFGFTARNRTIRLTLPLPDRADVKFTRHSRGVRSPAAAAEAFEQEVRRRWRSLALLVKAKLAAVTDGITEFEEEFLAHTVLPGGKPSPSTRAATSIG